MNNIHPIMGAAIRPHLVFPKPYKWRVHYSAGDAIGTIDVMAFEEMHARDRAKINLSRQFGANVSIRIGGVDEI
jgi:hypothetical protein